MRDDLGFDDVVAVARGARMRLCIRHVVDFPDADAPLAAFDAITWHLERNLDELARDIAERAPIAQRRVLRAALAARDVEIEIVLGPTTRLADAVLDQVRSDVQFALGREAPIRVVAG
jgi:hypothetical protein